MLTSRKGGKKEEDSGLTEELHQNRCKPTLVESKNKSTELEMRSSLP